MDNAYRHPAVSKALILGIAVTLMGATVSGVAMDGGRAIGLAGVRTDFTIVGSAYADDHDREKHGEDRDEHGIMEEIHEALSSLVVLFVVLHAGYLLLFRRPLARFMLYREPTERLNVDPYNVVRRYRRRGVRFVQPHLEAAMKIDDGCVWGQTGS